MKARSTELEIMDDLDCHGPVVNQTLRELEFINRWLGGNNITLDGLKRIINPRENKTYHIADMGCGGGDMLKLIARWGAHKKLKFQLTGIDANPHIIQFASENCRSYPSIALETGNVFSPVLQRRPFDIIVATLFTHHFAEAELIELFKAWHNQASAGIVINDLHRHPLAFHSIKLLTRLFSKSAMVKFDAPLSVKRGFSRRELVRILEKAGITNYSLHWRWAFRWQLIIPRSLVWHNFS